jgi:carboxypeptidase C (cathepsin A)
MRKIQVGWILFFLIMLGQRALSTEVPAGDAGEKKKSLPAELPKAEQSVTQHKIVIGGVAISYAATAGTMIVRDLKDQPCASMGYVAYMRNDAIDPSRRPITFAYNGGPGTSSIFLHMGALGPKRVVTLDAISTPPPPYTIVENESSLLDKTDLVMIDPVGTGFSKAVGEAKEADFWGVDRDIESIASFIKQYVTENGRWNSPKYLLGESYGTTRSAGVVDYLQTRGSMSFNGVIMVSLATDLDAILDSLLDGGARYHLITFPLYIPSYAAVAWYHKVLSDRPAKLEPFLEEARSFALGQYARALALGNQLPKAERKAVVEKLHRFTGLSAEYLEMSDLQVGITPFVVELLRERRETVGQLDARFTGVSFDPLGEKATYDPMDSSTTPAFVAAFQDYLHRELNFGQGKTYIVQAEAWKSWDYRHKIEGSEIPQPMVNTGVDLAHAMGFNPNLKVLVLQGIFDLGTPLLATEYMVSHLDLRKDLRSHIEMKYYEAGHLMYLHETSLKKFKEDVGTFITASSGH